MRKIKIKRKDRKRFSQRAQLKIITHSEPCDFLAS
jgi:hypothetical protein